MVESYRKPRTIRIGRTVESEKLYRLEERCHAAIKACAAEWARVVGEPAAPYFQVQLPQALFDLLESYDVHASTLAATAYLEAQGYSVVELSYRKEGGQ